eukprot:Gb_31944 [translate_table: standard]
MKSVADGRRWPTVVNGRRGSVCRPPPMKPQDACRCSSSTKFPVDQFVVGAVPLDRWTSFLRLTNHTGSLWRNQPSPGSHPTAYIGDLSGITQCWRSRLVLRLPHSADLSGITPCWPLQFQLLSYCLTTPLQATRPILWALTDPLSLRRSAIWQRNGAFNHLAPKSPECLDLSLSFEGFNCFFRLQRASLQRLSGINALQWLSSASSPSAPLVRLFILLTVIRPKSPSLSSTSELTPPTRVSLPPSIYHLTDNVRFSIFTDELQNPLDRLTLAESTIATHITQPHRLTLAESTIATLIECLSRRSVGNATQGSYWQNLTSPLLIHGHTGFLWRNQPSPGSHLTAYIGALSGITQCWRSRPVLRLPHLADLSGITPCWPLQFQLLSYCSTTPLQATSPILWALIDPLSLHRSAIWQPSSVSNRQVCNGSLASMPCNNSQARLLLQLLQPKSPSLSSTSELTPPTKVSLRPSIYHLTDNVEFSIFTDKLQNPLDRLTQKGFNESDAYKYFVLRAQKIAISHGYEPINWEETFNNFGADLNPKTVVHNCFIHLVP